MNRGNIAPHENQEINLVLNGAKNFAVIEKRKDIASYFAAGAISRPGITVQYQETETGPEVILTTRRELIAEYNSLLIDGVSRLGLKNYHRALGTIFGYSAADIEKFISSDIDCNCAKCSGGAVALKNTLNVLAKVRPLVKRENNILDVLKR